MKTICIMNLKGGVGKTVTADNMAAILAADHGKRVLLIDGDHQGNTSRFFLQEDMIVSTLRDILAGDSEPYWPENVYGTGCAGLDIIPADMALAELLRQVRAMNRVNPNLTLAGVLVTMWHNIDIMTQAERVLRSGSFPVFKTVIRRTDRVDESTFQRQPLVVYSPRSAACVDYRAMVREYLERGADCGQEV